MQLQQSFPVFATLLLAKERSFEEKSMRFQQVFPAGLWLRIGFKEVLWRNKSVVLFVTIRQNMTSWNLHYYFGTISKILHHQFVIHLSTMVKHAETLSQLPSGLKFPKSNSLSSLRTQPQFSIEKVPFARKVSQEQKQRLVQLITASNYNMMDAAKAVKISYSSAKKIFTRFRHNLREEIKRKAEDRVCTIRASYIIARSDSLLQPTLVKSVSLIAGLEQDPEGENQIIEGIDC